MNAVKKLVEKNTRYNMNCIRSTLVCLMLVVFNVKTIVNEVEKLESCVAKISSSLTTSIENNKNLLMLIDQSTVILKAFGSENLINFADENDDELKVGSRGSDGNESESEDDNYDDYYSYKSDDNENLKILMTFTPITVYKGTDILRQLELFSNPEYFMIKG